MHWDMLARLFMAGVFGAVIGFERKSRAKEAGLRTHFVVALGSALVMVVSKYGFTDTAAHIDPGRLAAQVVSGIGFLGAGTIIVQRQYVRGLTTAAGLWATSGIGLAIGAGMYGVGFGATVMVVLGLEILDRGFRGLWSKRSLRLAMRDEPGSLRRMTQVLEDCGIDVSKLHLQLLASDGNQGHTYEIAVSVPSSVNISEIISRLQEISGVDYVTTD